jgi:hypothetical protein
MDKLGSLIESTFCSESECDFCISSEFQKINKEVRDAFPFWFTGEGNILFEFSDIYLKKCRNELQRRVKKGYVWRVKCGFCDEPFGVCMVHLEEITKKLVEFKRSMSSCHDCGEPCGGCDCSSRKTEYSLRFLEGKTIEKIKHESQCLDSKPVFSIYFADGKMFRCYPICWDNPEEIKA